VWEASGHAAGFKDPMVSCRSEGCKGLFRADQLYRVDLYALEAIPEPGTSTAPELARSRTAGAALGLLWIENEPVEGAVAALRTLGGARRVRARAVAAADGSILHFFELDGRPHLWLRQTAPLLLKEGDPCPRCGGPLTEPRQFNLMFRSFVGALEDAAAQVWLRPETAQGIFVNFRNVLDTSRVKIPFGIAQIGKAFRNEINPRNYTFRSREFEQMEIEFFCRGAAEARPDEPGDMDWYAFWRHERYRWYIRHGLKSEKLRLREQDRRELAHYSRACADIEYLFPFSDEFQELEGVAHRGCFDLTQHETHSAADLHYFDEEGWSRFLAERKARGEPDLTREQKAALAGQPPFRFVPTVIEPSAGADRATLAFLCEAYCEDQAPDDQGVMQTRVVMKLHPRLAPIKAAFFPLVNKEGMPDIAHRLYREARQHFNVFYDDAGAIGRRYRRQDEAGTPWCITVDGQTLQDQTVTIRERDTLQQVRVGVGHVVNWLRERLELR
jgi:glycyl-tRNA synthetase